MRDIKKQISAIKSRFLEKEEIYCRIGLILKDILGEGIYSRIKDFYIKGGTLYVKTGRGIVSQEIRFRLSEFILKNSEKINQLRVM